MKRAAALALGLAALAGGAWLLAPARAASSQILFVSGMRIQGSKPVAFVRLTNTSPNPGDEFLVHYTISETGSGIALSAPGAGFGAPLAPGRTLELDLGKIVTLHRAANGVGPYTGTVQFVAIGEAGLVGEFSSETVHVESTQIEGRAVRDAVEQWVTP